MCHLNNLSLGGVHAKFRWGSWKLRPSLVHSETDKLSNLMTSESVKEKPEIVVGVIDQPIISSHGYTSRVSPFNSVSSFSSCALGTKIWISACPTRCMFEWYLKMKDFPLVELLSYLLPTHSLKSILTLVLQLNILFSTEW